MTDPSESDPVLPLPGLDTPSARAVPDLEVAVRRTLAELRKQGHINEVDAGKLQLALEMAQVIAIKKASGRASTIGNDARVLMEILDAFVGEASDTDELLEDAMERWGQAIRDGQATTEAPAIEWSA